jgi:hypothetical protein
MVPMTPMCNAREARYVLEGKAARKNKLSNFPNPKAMSMRVRNYSTGYFILACRLR